MSKFDFKLTLKDIERAREIIAPMIRKTEIDKSLTASQLLGSEVYLKFENEQFTGSFKIRGALNKIHHLSAAERAQGVVASSAGNHAQGVALSAQKMGVKSHIVMPQRAALIKVAATRHYGAEVILHGEIYDEAYAYARELEKKHGYIFVHPYEDPHIIAGQGTVGIEVLEAIPDLDSIVVPIGGGGLISGIALAIKTLRPQCKVYGVQSVAAPAMEYLFHKKNIKDLEGKKISTIADGISIKSPSQIMYDNFISKYVDEVVTVTDDEIAEAIVFLMEKAKTVTEGSGAAAFAAMLQKKFTLGPKTCVILSGGNIDLNIISKIIEKGQIAKGRLMNISVVVDDSPGMLSKLTKVIGDLGVNILEVHHDRVTQGLYLRETKIDFVLETFSHEHIEKLREGLKATGARIL